MCRISQRLMTFFKSCSCMFQGYFFCKNAFVLEWMSNIALKNTHTHTHTHTHTPTHTHTHTHTHTYFTQIVCLIIMKAVCFQNYPCIHFHAFITFSKLTYWQHTIGGYLIVFCERWVMNIICLWNPQLRACIRKTFVSKGCFLFFIGIQNVIMFDIQLSCLGGW